jgi:DNA-binding transcriptional ArsR family regulator
MRHQPGGLAASVIAETIGCPPNTLSSHLAVLVRAGLIAGRRDGRSIVYRADIEGMRALIDFLVTDCCGGRPELCRLAEGVTANCGEPAPIRTSRKEVAR